MIPITRPMTPAEVSDMEDRYGYIRVAVQVGLDDLIQSREVFDKYIRDRVLLTGSLSDISYKIIGHTFGGWDKETQDNLPSEALIEVTGQVVGLYSLYDL